MIKNIISNNVGMAFWASLLLLHLWPRHHLSLFIQTKWSFQDVMHPIPFVQHFQLQQYPTPYSRINLGRRLSKWLRLSLHWRKILLKPNLTRTSVCEKNLIPIPNWSIYHLEYRLSRNLFQTHSQSTLKYKICDMLSTTYRMCLEKKYELCDIPWHHLLSIEGYFKSGKTHLNHKIKNTTAIFVNMKLRKQHAFWDIGGCLKSITPSHPWSSGVDCTSQYFWPSMLKLL